MLYVIREYQRVPEQIPHSTSSKTITQLWILLYIASYNQWLNWKNFVKGESFYDLTILHTLAKVQFIGQIYIAYFICISTSHWLENSFVISIYYFVRGKLKTLECY